MRPALLRLLKRPSALSILDSLAATPIGIEQLESRYTRLRRQSQCARGVPLDETEGSSSRQESGNPMQTGGEGRPFSFPVYEIEPSSEPHSSEILRADNSDRNDSAERLKSSLRLQLTQLEFESDIGHTKDIGTRLVDSSAHRHDFELWEELLRFRQRHYGDKGTQDIWDGLTVRLDGVKLPVAGERADFFWQSFVNLGLKRPLFLNHVVEYAINIWEDQNVCWDKLYRSVVGGLLNQGMQEQAVVWHRKLQACGLARADELVHVLPHAIRSKYLSTGMEQQSHLRRLSPFKRLSTFRRMLLHIPGHQIYGPVISTLLQLGYGEYAVTIHQHLVGHGDHPKTFDELQPLMEYVKNFGFRKDFHRIESYARDRFEEEMATAEREMQTSHKTVRGDNKGGVAETKPFKNDIGARLFATRGLNFDMILGALKMLGVSAIGPQTVREMAIRAHGGQDILEKIKMLRKSGISIHDTVFTRLIQKLAAQNRDILLSDLLRSDQHPDAFEDTEMQESLLVSYYIARDSRQYNMSLAVLAELFPDAPDLLDVHFRKHIAAGELDAASKVVDELVLRGRTLTEDSVDYMAAKVLRPRRMNRRPPLGKLISPADEVMFIFKILQRVVPAGVYVSTSFWVELLKRLGMSNEWDGLRECCLWLVREYSHKAQSQSGKAWGPSHLTTAPAPGRDGQMVNLIFAPAMQQAIVHWGFSLRVTEETQSKLTYTHPMTGAKLIPWTRGICLLLELEQAGLGLRTREIRRAARSRLAMLFSRWCPSQRRMNRMLRRNNPYGLERVTMDILRAWGSSTLFNGLEVSQPGRLVNPPRTKFSRRRTARVRLARTVPP